MAEVSADDDGALTEACGEWPRLRLTPIEERRGEVYRGLKGVFARLYTRNCARGVNAPSELKPVIIDCQNWLEMYALIEVV